jgi:hypothetical protein
MAIQIEGRRPAHCASLRPQTFGWLVGRLFFLLTPPMKMEQTECSETSAHKIHTLGNNLCPYKYDNNLTPVILPAYTAYEDGTNRMFRNVGT